MTRRYTLAILAASVAGLLLAASPAVRAAHDNGLDCYRCHNLSGDNNSFTEAGTKAILFWTIDPFKKAGWTAGRNLGCTYCHRDEMSPQIPDVLSIFKYDWTMNRYALSLPSHHPVTASFLDNTFDNTAYLSSDNTYSPRHLDCIDCHDQTLVTYPNHNPDWIGNSGGGPQRNRSTNPYALRAVSQPKAYDDLCRSCHTTGGGFMTFTNRGGAQPGKTPPTSGKLLISSHALGTDNGSAAIRDLDNTNLRPQDQQYVAKRQCTVCHDAHKSSNYHLFSDGYESGGETPIAEGDCALVCHYQGDPQGNFLTKGHGKQTFWDGQQFDLNCRDCHSVDVPHNRNATGYLERYRFANLPSTDLDNSVYGNRIVSVCGKCHDYPTHGQVGCIDCHDQHAKRSDNNWMMIRSTNKVAGSRVGVLSGPGSAVGTENVVFVNGDKYPDRFNPTPPYHFVVTSDNSRRGVCDQRACHGGKTVKRKINGTDAFLPLYPMAVYLSTDNAHSGGRIAIDNVSNVNCASCHKHNDAAGSFRASSSCLICHGQPPPPSDIDYPYNEARSPHLKHAGNQPTSNQYGYECQACHANYTDPATHNTQPPTYQSVLFLSDWDRGGAAYNGQFMRCSALTCHSDGRGGAPDCTTFQWYVLDNLVKRSTLGCTDCHKHRSPMLTTGAHATHLSAPNSLPCASCHYGIVATDNDQRIIRFASKDLAPGTAAHVNNERNVVINPIFNDNGTFAWNPTDNTCFGVTCHGGRVVRWSPPQTLTCDECHGYARNTPVPATAYDYTFQRGFGPMSKVAPALFAGRGHGSTTGLPWDNASNPGASGALSCPSCHDRLIPHDNASNPFRFLATIRTNSVTPDNVNSVCDACHTFANRSLEHSSAVTGGGQRGLPHQQRCVDCHDVHGQQNIYMVYDNLPSSVFSDCTSSNVYGIPRNPAVRSAVSFLSVDNGSSFASTTLDGSYADGVCETCHTRTRQYANGTGSGTSGPNSHPTRACIECHRHALGFRGVGGSNVEQYFDCVVSSSNFRDLSRHPLARGAQANQAGTVVPDCLQCHGVSPLGTGLKSNECIRCHKEAGADNAVYHPDGLFKWAVPNDLNSTYTPAPQDNLDGFCLQCHGGGNFFPLNGVTPRNILPSGEGTQVAGWTGGSGHGSTSQLTRPPEIPVGPPAYHCWDCHYSSVAMATSPNARDNRAPTFHASINRKLVGNENAADHEYPHPADNVYTDNNARSGLMDGFCAVKCHQPSNVVRHTWDRLGGGSQADNQTHPSNVPIVPGSRYRTPDNLPLSENYTAAPPAGAGNVVCVTCHNPHGGASGLRADNGATLTGGQKQMMRGSFSGDNGAVCKECHK